MLILSFKNKEQQKMSLSPTCKMVSQLPYLGPLSQGIDFLSPKYLLVDPGFQPTSTNQCLIANMTCIIKPCTQNLPQYKTYYCTYLSKIDQDQV